MSDWIEQEDWSTVKVGDQVRLTHESGDELKGYVEFVFNGHDDDVHRFHLQVPSLYDAVEIRDSEWLLSVPAKPAVVLPSEPGNYCDKNGDGWRIRENATSTLPEEYAPYTRFEPVDVTAKKVLERVSEILRGVDLPNEFGTLAKEFGVTDE